MTQQPFSRPGAVDLAGLQAPPAGGATGAPGVSGAYTVVVDEANFQTVLESSMSAAVLLAFFSSSRSPESMQLADDLQLLSNEFEGRFLLGRVDIDANPQIAKAMQIPSVPLVVLVAQGRPMPLLQNAAPIEELRSAITQVLQQLTTSGFAGRHQPRAAEVDAETGEEIVDPRYLPAQDALERGDIAGAVAEYQKLVDANRGDAEAAAGLAMALLLQRTEGVDLNEARAAAAAAPDDVAAQTMVADLDLLGGHVEDAFVRLVNLVGRTSDADRDAARTHLIGLFGAVGNDDPRVQKARRDLTSALF
ncbi:co-chaperone YbbN [Nocardioides marmoriginsengisoli]|uniref:Co-chaperone YbbN n=1 Tax=Nocardioides marmoriginsengisoli TaxID=661483 RepID=A0A3N0CIU8_9ACTN|nr:tetratricopeptide repeat protein [Nocardioides marmoriginsengisoli]RNL63259.1 co-chaperone YbbN [Nocardioides marmoriginsengisoli]